MERLKDRAKGKECRVRYKQTACTVEDRLGVPRETDGGEEETGKGGRSGLML
jgi:hypothetical protein